MSKSKKGFDFKVLKRVVQMGMAYRLLFSSVVLVALATSAISIVRPILVRDIVDVYITPKDYDGLVNILLILGGILVIEVLLQFFMVYFANIVAQRVIKDLRIKLFNRLTSFKLAYFDRTPLGVLVTRSVSDIETVAQVFNDGILVILGDALRIIFVVITMYVINWKLATVVLLILPFMIIITRVFQRALKKVYQAERTLVSKLNSFIEERISGMQIVQLFNRQKAEYEKFKAINHDLKKAYLKTVFYFSLLFPVVELVSSVTIAAIIWYGGWYGNATPGDVLAYVLFTNMLIRPMRQVAERFNSIQRGLVGADRVFGIIDSDHSIGDTGTKKLENVKGQIDFENVRFSYIPDEEVLKGISLAIKPGQTVAIVGATGAGKSTIINLLSRFYDINSGHIRIDHTDIKEITLDSLRAHIAVVLQDVFLFNTTLLENITLGSPTITLETVKNAAKEIGIHNFIESLPKGYHSSVSERGGSLSVGQRQLISFLRAYVYDPEILVLDEATSSIDTESEELIQAATEKLTQGRTSIVIAHRLATIQKADLIVVMDKGTIVEQGTHTELLAMNGYYNNLHEVQFKKNS